MNAGSRPANETATEQAPTPEITVGRPSDSTPAVDLLHLSPRDREVWDAGYLTGYCHGHDAGWKAADDRAAALHAVAFGVVQKLATYPTHAEIENRRHEGLWGSTP